MSNDPEDQSRIEAVLRGERDSFEPLVEKYSPRVFALVRRHARGEDEVRDIAQEIWLKAYQKLSSYRADAPFEHWLMRISVRTCYDFLRKHRRSRESPFADLSEAEARWLESFARAPETADDQSQAAGLLVQRLLDQLSPAARLIITLLEIEERPVKEIARLTGWSVPLVKVRAFRARAEMRKLLARIDREKYL